MSEPTVEVPVSLIEALPVTGGWHPKFAQPVEAIRALLPKPDPDEALRKAIAEILRGRVLASQEWAEETARAALAVVREWEMETFARWCVNHRYPEERRDVEHCGRSQWTATSESCGFEPCSWTPLYYRRTEVEG